jgi:hypothetical protein
VTADDNDEQWYVRRGSSIQGPYDAAQIHRYLLLGRVRLTDRISLDGENWQALTQRGELIPEEMRDLESEEGRARFEAARRAVDERERERAEGQPLPGGQRAGDPPGRAHALRWPLAGFAALAAIAATLALGGYLLELPGGVSIDPDCGAAAAPRVDWSYCVKDGLELAPGTDLSGLRALNASLREARIPQASLRAAELAYADLAGADLHGSDLAQAGLRGANLRRADLRKTRLVGADLTYADLRGADLAGAELAGADFGHAVWIDGSPCPPDSIGGCGP